MLCEMNIPIVTSKNKKFDFVTQEVVFYVQMCRSKELNDLPFISASVCLKKKKRMPPFHQFLISEIFNCIRCFWVFQFLQQFPTNDCTYCIVRYNFQWSIIWQSLRFLAIEKIRKNFYCRNALKKNAFKDQNKSQCQSKASRCLMEMLMTVK